MTNTNIELSEDAFAALFPLRKNYLNPGAGWQDRDGTGCLFETYGDEFAYVEQCDNRTIWTLVDHGDGKESIESGFHLVNCIGYLVSTVAVPKGVEIRVGIQTLYEPKPDRVAKFNRVILDYTDSDQDTNLVDLLADAMHWSRANRVSFEQSLITATTHFSAETNS